VLNDAPHALQLAKDNWAVQREVADVRILLEAALATRDEPTLTLVSEWLRASQLEDAHIRQLTAGTLNAAVVHPNADTLRKQQQP